MAFFVFIFSFVGRIVGYAHVGGPGFGILGFTFCVARAVGILAGRVRAGVGEGSVDEFMAYMVVAFYAYFTSCTIY